MSFTEPKHKQNDQEIKFAIAKSANKNERFNLHTEKYSSLKQCNLHYTQTTAICVSVESKSPLENRSFTDRGGSGPLKPALIELGLQQPLQIQDCLLRVIRHKAP